MSSLHEQFGASPLPLSHTEREAFAQGEAAVTLPHMRACTASAFAHAHAQHTPQQPTPAHGAHVHQSMCAPLVPGYGMPPKESMRPMAVAKPFPPITVPDTVMPLSFPFVSPRLDAKPSLLSALSLQVLDHTVHRINRCKAAKVPSASVTAPRSDSDAYAPASDPMADSSCTNAELVVSNLRFFSLRVGLASADGRRVYRIPGEQLVARAELLYENGLPVSTGTLHDAETQVGAEPPLTGKTEMAMTEGEATFKLRINRLSSRCGLQRFRVRVTVEPRALAPVPEEHRLSVVTHPMKCVTKLSARSAELNPPGPKRQRSVAGIHSEVHSQAASGALECSRSTANNGYASFGSGIVTAAVADGYASQPSTPPPLCRPPLSEVTTADEPSDNGKRAREADSADAAPAAAPPPPIRCWSLEDAAAAAAADLSELADHASEWFKRGRWGAPEELALFSHDNEPSPAVEPSAADLFAAVTGDDSPVDATASADAPAMDLAALDIPGDSDDVIAAPAVATSTTATPTVVTVGAARSALAVTPPRQASPPQTTPVRSVKRCVIVAPAGDDEPQAEVATPTPATGANPALSCLQSQIVGELEELKRHMASLVAKAHQDMIAPKLEAP